MSSPRRELRIGDRERDLVATVLQDALAQGRITLEELDQRLDATLRARTYADLDALVADLPVEPPSTALTGYRPGVEPRPGVEFRPAGAPSGAPGAAPDDRLVLDAGWSSVTREGRWDVPPFLQLNGAVGNVRLNCLRATPLAATIDVLVNGGLGHITLVVPDAWAASTDRLSTGWGRAVVRVSARPEPGAPLLLLHGTVGWGRLTVRYANRRDRRKLARQAALRSPDRRELGR
jgi:hypothetical protein